jgi:hypothetical protein
MTAGALTALAVRSLNRLLTPYLTWGPVLVIQLPLDIDAARKGRADARS